MEHGLNGVASGGWSGVERLKMNEVALCPQKLPECRLPELQALCQTAKNNEALEWQR